MRKSARSSRATLAKNRPYQLANLRLPGVTNKVTGGPDSDREDFTQVDPGDCTLRGHKQFVAHLQHADRVWPRICRIQLCT